MSVEVNYVQFIYISHIPELADLEVFCLFAPYSFWKNCLSSFDSFSLFSLSFLINGQKTSLM